MSPELQVVVDEVGKNLDRLVGDINAVNVHHSTSVAAIVSLLIAKGICTKEEFLAALTAASAEIDQHMATLRDAKEQPD